MSEQGGYSYLASPYSHPDPAIREERFKLVCRAAGILMKQGRIVFSPIAHTHPIDAELDTTHPVEFWMKQDIPLLRHSNRLVVLMLGGWLSSKGVGQEIDLARKMGLPIEFIQFSDGVLEG